MFMPSKDLTLCVTFFKGFRDTEKQNQLNLL